MNTSTARQECATLSLYTTSRTNTDTIPMLSFVMAAKIPRLEPRSTVPLDQGSRSFLLMCAVSMLRRGSPELQQVRLPVRFVLDSVFVCTYVLLY